MIDGPDLLGACLAVAVIALLYVLDRRDPKYVDRLNLALAALMCNPILLFAVIVLIALCVNPTAFR